MPKLGVLILTLKCDAKARRVNFNIKIWCKVGRVNFNIKMWCKVGRVNFNIKMCVFCFTGAACRPYVNTVKGFHDLVTWKNPPYTLIAFIVSCWCQEILSVCAFISS